MKQMNRFYLLTLFVFISLLNRVYGGELILLIESSFDFNPRPNYIMDYKDEVQDESGYKIITSSDDSLKMNLIDFIESYPKFEEYGDLSQELEKIQNDINTFITRNPYTKAQIQKLKFTKEFALSKCSTDKASKLCLEISKDMKMEDTSKRKLSEEDLPEDGFQYKVERLYIYRLIRTLFVFEQSGPTVHRDQIAMIIIICLVPILAIAMSPSRKYTPQNIVIHLVARSEEVEETNDPFPTTKIPGYITDEKVDDCECCPICLDALCEYTSPTLSNVKNPNIEKESFDLLDDSIDIIDIRKKSISSYMSKKKSLGMLNDNRIIRKLPCNHYLHDECAIMWGEQTWKNCDDKNQFAYSCALCRREWIV